MVIEDVLFLGMVVQCLGGYYISLGPLKSFFSNAFQLSETSTLHFSHPSSSSVLTIESGSNLMAA